MQVVIHPKKLKGILDCIPSKSYSHRAIIAASLAPGKSLIKNVLFSEDIKRTIECCEAFGAKIKVNKDSLEIEGTKEIKRVKSSINCGESGSTIRFMIPLMLVNKEPMEFNGMNHLVKRPLDIYLEIFDKLKIKYEKGEDYLPLKTYGGLIPTTYEVKGDVSSQFITGLLLALPLLAGDSKIKIIGKLQSKAYIDLTLDILKTFGIKIINHNYEEFIIPGKQTYLPHDYTIEGDYSQAAFFLAMGALGNDVKLRCMNLNSLQGDKKIIDDLKALGAEVLYEDGLLYAKPKEHKNAVIDFAQSPDLGPVLSVVAALTKGKQEFINCERLRIKECDRITCVKEELNKLGAKVSETASTMEFIGVDKFKGTITSSHNDHRVAMALAVASTVMDNDLVIDGSEAVKKSYPNFWDDFKKLGGDFDERA